VPEQQLIPLADEKGWLAALKALPYLPAHSRAYNHTIALHTGAEHFLYHFSEGVQAACCPLAVRQKSGIKEVFTPYGFSGLCTNGSIKKFWEQFRAFMQQEGFVTGYMLQHPFCALPEQSKTFPTRPLFALNLRFSLDELLDNMHQTHRYEIRRWLELPDITTSIEKTSEARNAFLQFYPEAMKRSGASSAYAFSAKTLNAFMDMPECLIVSAAHKGKIEAVSLFLHSPSGADYFLSASTENGRRHSRGLIWKAAEALKERSIPQLFLGGGIKAGDDLEQFKRRFGGTPYEGTCYKEIFNQAAYQALCKQHGVSTEIGTGYFPPYWA
jgi:hypothetical protein